MSRTVAGTTPYAWPFDGLLEAARVAIIVAGANIEWRERCVAPESAMDAIKRLLALRAAGAWVVGLRHPAAGRTGEPILNLTPHLDLDIAAAGIDGFFDSSLDGHLRRLRRDQLVMCGFGLEGPVHSTLRSANDRGYECLTVIDASAPLQTSTADAAISTITMSGGIFGAVGWSAGVLAAFAGDIPIPVERSSPWRSAR